MSAHTTLASAVARSDVLFALDRAEGKNPITAQDALALMTARGGELDRLLNLASALRDEGLRARGREGLITYSRKVFIPVTTLCRDRCHYCIFVDTPGKLEAQGKPVYMSPEQILKVARDGAALGCKEALFTLGDRPEERWPIARQWLDQHGYATTVDYLRAMGELVLDETGLLPHMNPGVLTWREMQQLRPVSPSMGMMLETVSTSIWEQPGGAHFGSPDKDPALRMRVIEDAGAAKIPFSTGVLLGIGETDDERAEAMFTLRDIQQRHGGIQEVIVQNFRVKPRTAMQNETDLELHEYVAAVAVSRLVLGPHMTIQAPPNLSEEADLTLLVRAGIDDWGGVSPLTPDHVNPERPWPHVDNLARHTAKAGYALTERLTVHPEYVRDADRWIDRRLHSAVRALAEPDGLGKTGINPTPRRDQATATEPGTASARRNSVSSNRATSRLAQVLRRAEQRPTELSDADYAQLLEAEGADLHALAALADGLRAASHGSQLTFVANRNLDSTRYRQLEDAPNSGLLAGYPAPPAIDDDSLAALTAEAWQRGATEICAQGAPPAHAGANAYADFVRTVKTAAPGIHLHAFRPAELLDGAARLGLPLDDFVHSLREAGLDSVPGTAARVLDDALRTRLSNGTDISAASWERTIRTAHAAGLRSTATVIYGHIETPEQTVAHLRRLIRIHDDTGGFSEFIPMPYVPTATTDPFGQGPTLRHSIALHAVARLILNGTIDHIQAAWTKLGLADTATILRSGADDAGGLLMGGGMQPFAGAEAGKELGVGDIEALATRLGRHTRQRTTGYGQPSAERGHTLRDNHRPSGPIVREPKRTRLEVRAT